MAKYSSNEKKKLAQKLKNINVINEKDILNIKVSDLKKINENENIANLTMKDIQILWLMQEAIENRSLLDFFTNTE